MIEDGDFEMEVDSESGRKYDPKEIKISTTLCESMAFSKNTFMKPCNSKELVDETEKIFQQIVNLTLTEKLSILSEEKSPVDET